MTDNTEKKQADLFTAIDDFFIALEEINEKIEQNTIAKVEDKINDSK